MTRRRGGEKDVELGQEGERVERERERRRGEILKTRSEGCRESRADWEGVERKEGRSKSGGDVGGVRSFEGVDLGRNKKKTISLSRSIEDEWHSDRQGGCRIRMGWEEKKQDVRSIHVRPCTVPNRRYRSGHLLITRRPDRPNHMVITLQRRSWGRQVRCNALEEGRERYRRRVGLLVSSLSLLCSQGMKVGRGRVEGKGNVPA